MERFPSISGTLAMVAFLALHAATAVSAQTSEVEMLPEMLAGKRYRLTTYDEHRRIEKRTDFLVQSPDPSSPELQPDRIELTIEVLRLDDDGRVASRKIVRWVCDSNASRMAMPILVLSGKPLQRDARLEVLGTPILYPESPSFEGPLPDVELTLEIQGGILSLLGSRGRFSLEDRRAVREGDHVLISGKGEFKGYLAGIRLKHKVFSSEAVLGPSGKLLRQDIRFPDGSRSTLELQPSGDRQPGTGIDEPLDSGSPSG